MILFIFIIILIFILLNNILKNDTNHTYEYFDNNLQIYYINLKNSSDRNNKMLSQCNNLNCNRVNAIDGKTLDIQNIDLQIHNHKLSRNCIACFLSHINCLKNIINNNEDYALILEDDIIFENNFIEKLKIIKKELPNNYDILFLGGTRICGKKYSKHLLKQKQINKDCNAGAFAYLITKNCCKKILKRIYQDGIYKMYDHQIRDYFIDLNIFYTNPMLVNHNYEFESDRANKKYNKNYIDNSSIILIE